jgi:hypothetical protein
MYAGRFWALLAAISGAALLGACADDAEGGDGGTGADTDTDTDTDSDVDGDSDPDIPEPDPAAPFAAVELFTSES